MADADKEYGFPDEAGADDDQPLISVRLALLSPPLRGY